MLNSKIRPRAVVGYGVKIFHPSPPNYVTRSPGRVGGRLRRADLPHETKHPAILPWKSHVTTLLIRHAHKRLGHAGHGHVISNLREKYWIIKVNTAVRHVISKCVFCRRNYRRPGVQKMADLPKTEESKYTALLIT